MTRKTKAAGIMATLLAAAPAYAHHEYSSNEGLLSVLSGSAYAFIALGMIGLVAAGLMTNRKSR